VDGPILIREQQADCVAGAWLAYMGTIGALEQGDIGDVERLIRFIASAETPDRDHGTLTERTNAFDYGYENGLVGCNEYFPSTPLLVSR
jgi:predicted metalloprotease